MNGLFQNVCLHTPTEQRTMVDLMFSQELYLGPNGKRIEGVMEGAPDTYAVHRQTDKSCIEKEKKMSRHIIVTTF